LGPLVSFQDAAVTLVPLPAVAVPVRVIELVGRVIVGSPPALTTGGVLAAVVPPFTVTETVEEADCPRLLVAVKVKI
jgi:hypothetical protein